MLEENHIELAEYVAVGLPGTTFVSVDRRNQLFHGRMR